MNTIHYTDHEDLVRQIKNRRKEQLISILCEFVKQEDKKEVTMDKSMLKDGFKVVLRNKEYGYFLESKGIIAIDIRCVLSIDGFKYNLERNDGAFELDIVEIYDHSGNLVCKRKEEYKPSEQEIALFKLIDKELKWIAVDTDDKVFLYEFKPTKSRNVHYCSNGTYLEINTFKNIIKLTWDDEPVELDKWR